MAIRFAGSRLFVFIVLLSGILVRSSTVDATTHLGLVVAHPAASSQISGVYTFQASLSTAVASSSVGWVEFYLGSRRLGIATQPPFTLTWNTAWAADGEYELEVNAKAPNGSLLASTATSFTINNLNNSLSLTSPSISSPWKGAVTLAISGADSQYYPAIWQVLIDGTVVGVAYTDNSGTQQNKVTVKFDTAAFPNGTHELYIGMHSDFWVGADTSDKSFYNNRGGLDEIVQFANGHQFMEVAPNFQSLYLEPNGTGIIGCRRHFTDGTYGKCVQPTYTSSNSSTVSVSAHGKVAAGAAEGFAIITVSDGGKSANSYVWVRKDSAVVHFAGNGQILDAYAPDASLFVVAPFDLAAEDMINDPSLTQAVLSSAVNSISEGLYQNPRNTTMTFQEWLSYYNQNIAPDWQFAASNGFHIVATGDEICRNPGVEGWYTLNWPPAQEAVQYAVQQLAASGVAISIEMVDEADSLWGVTPDPPGQIGETGGPTEIDCSGNTCTVDWPNNPIWNGTNFAGSNFALSDSPASGLGTPVNQLYSAANISTDGFSFAPATSVTGSFTAANDPSLAYVWWAGDLPGCPSQPCDPAVPNNALTTISSWIHEALPSVPISWPLSAESQPSVFGNWMGPNSVSDYASHYWTSYNERPAYAWSTGVEEANSWLTEEFYSRQPYLVQDKPQLMEVSMSGPEYQKETAGDPYYNPGQDILIQPGTIGPVVFSQMMTEAALGVAGERLYFFEPPSQEVSRAAAPIGSVLQTGANPIATDPVIQENWEALQYGATALTQVLTPFLFQTQRSSPSFGANLVTSLRTGAAGTMLLIVNDNDWSREVAVKLGSYGDPSNAYRYEVGAYGAQMTSPTGKATDEITLSPGQSVAYLFPSSGQLQALREIAQTLKQ